MASKILSDMRSIESNGNALIAWHVSAGYNPVVENKSGNRRHVFPEPGGKKSERNEGGL